jgi:ABC-2 type transport system permease protein
MAGVPRVLLVAYLAFRGSLVGLRAVALGALAAVPTLIVLAIATGGAGAGPAENAAQALFLSLTLRVVVVLTVLVLFVGLFRSEIELDTLTYLSTRSIPRPAIAVGKYLGGLGAALVFLVPAALLPLGVAGAAGAPAPPAAIPATLVALVGLASVAYGAFFLLLGLVSRSALLFGLIYGFLWEELILLLPGQFPKLTVLYYLLSLGAAEVTSGPLAGFPTAVPSTVAIAVPLLVGLAWVVVSAVLVRFVETAPQRISA